MAALEARATVHEISVDSAYSSIDLPAAYRVTADRSMAWHQIFKYLFRANVLVFQQDFGLGLGVWRHGLHS
jgi:hypothetical protein